MFEKLESLFHSRLMLGRGSQDRLATSAGFHYTQSTLRSETSQPAINQERLSAKGFRFAIVASRWNDAIVSRLIDGARDALAKSQADKNAIEIFRVPGSFEIPLCALKAAESGKFDAVICLGVIIRGETPHFEYIASETARGIGAAALKTGVPLLFGIITADNIEQANARAVDAADNKGFEAAMAAVELVNLYREAFEEVMRTE
jgi:6,7-dimethyl-8-ribityllumazine synthase